MTRKFIKGSLPGLLVRFSSASLVRTSGRPQPAHSLARPRSRTWTTKTTTTNSEQPAAGATGAILGFFRIFKKEQHNDRQNHLRDIPGG
jgi:hypothetical protein